MIFISSGVFICETLEVLKDGSDESKNIKDNMHLVEGTCVIIFTVEYVIRMSVCTHRPARNKSFWSYFFEFMNLIDFFAVAPWYVELAFDQEGGGFAVLRILRLARIFRIVKVGTFKENLDLVIESLRRSKAGLLLLVYLVLIFMVIMSSILYMVEEEEEGTAFTVQPSPPARLCLLALGTAIGCAAGKRANSRLMLVLAGYSNDVLVHDRDDDVGGLRRHVSHLRLRTVCRLLHHALRHPHARRFANTLTLQFDSLTSKRKKRKKESSFRS